METEEVHMNWSELDFEAYLSGTLSSDREHRLEADLLDDPFLSESLEGYRSAQGSLKTKAIDAKWKERSGISSGSSGSKGILGPLVMGLVAAITVVFIWTLYNQSELGYMTERVNESIEESLQLEQVYADSLAVLEIDLARTIEPSEEIRPDETKRDQAEIVLFEGERLERSSAPKPLVRLGPDSSEKIRVKEIGTPSPEIFYVQDLKLADYRPDYGEELFLKGDFLTGTDAVYEQEKNELRQVPEILLVDYELIMNSALERFNARDYKNTLAVLRRIEKKHPNDVNAAFYGGLCYYNLGKWTQADRRFRRTLSHPRKVFDQEGEWYLALSLRKQEDFERANVILEGIVEKEGFYAKKARALL